MFEHTQENEQEYQGQEYNRPPDGEHIFIIRGISELTQSRANMSNWYYVLTLQAINHGGRAFIKFMATKEGNLIHDSLGQMRWNKLCKVLKLPYGKVSMDDLIGNVFKAVLKTNGAYQNVYNEQMADDYERDLAAKWEVSQLSMNEEE